MSTENQPDDKATARPRKSRAERDADDQEAFERFLAASGQTPWALPVERNDA